jgi:hypothetical protein
MPRRSEHILHGLATVVPVAERRARPSPFSTWLKSHATIVALLRMHTVVGIRATVDSNNHITRLGVTCALCHSTVDNSVMPGI